MLRYLHRKLIKPIFTINGTPHSIALGTALGVFVALTPTVGFQMLLVVIIGTMIRANRIIAVILCWISNPITFIPMYFGYYWLGGRILGIELWTFGNFSRHLDDLMVIREKIGYFASLKQLGFETALPLWVGSLIIATVATIPVYPLTLRALHKHRGKKKDPGRALASEEGILRQDGPGPNAESASPPPGGKPAVLTSCACEDGRGGKPMHRVEGEEFE